MASLEFEVDGVNRIEFDPALRVYDLWLPAEATTAIVRVETMDPAARATWYVPDGAGMLAGGTIGVGAGEVTVDLPPDGFALYVGVFPPGGATDTYIVNMSPLCPQGDPCHNGGVPGTCFGGVCVTSCVPTSEVCDDGVDNDCDGDVDFADDTCSSLIALSVDLSSNVLEIDGPQVAYTATINNPVASIATVGIQGWIEQGAASRAALGTDVRCGVVPDGELPVGTCVFDYVTRASNTGAGTGAVVAGPATLRFVLDLEEGANPPLVLSEIEMPITLVEVCVPVGEICDDGVDNDCDGLVDSEDDDCISVDAGADLFVTEGDSVQFSGDVLGASEYEWDFGDGTPPETGTLTPTHVYADDGVYDVTLTMTTSGGASYTDALQVTVQNADPTLVAGSDVSGNQLTVDGTFNDPGTLDTHIAWIDWGDGEGGPAAVTESPFGPPGSVTGMNGTVTGSHTYTSDGTYTVTVTVDDDDGGVVAYALVADVGCVVPVDEICDDGIDNDCDGLVDSADDDCAPPAACPCFTAEVLQTHRGTWTPPSWPSNIGCWEGGDQAPGGMSILGAGTQARAYLRSNPALGGADDIYCYRQMLAPDGTVTLSGWGTPPGAGQVQITTEEWNACLNLLQAEAADANLLPCFECNTWPECDPAGTVNCIDGYCVPN